MTEPLSTRTLLKTEITYFLDTSNTEITNRIDTFVFLVEQELNRRYIPSAAWSRRYHTVTSSSATARFVTLPPETVRITRVNIDQSPYTPLQQYTPSGLMRKYPTFDRGKPVGFAVLGEVLEFSHTPDQNYTIDIVSRQRIWPLGKDVSEIQTQDYQNQVTAISNEVEQNYWTAHAADLLLLGALARGFKFMRDDKKADTTRKDFSDALMEFERYTTAKSMTADQGVSPPAGTMIV